MPIQKAKVKSLRLPSGKQPQKFLPNQTSFINEENDKVSVKISSKKQRGARS